VQQPTQEHQPAHQSGNDTAAHRRKQKARGRNGSSSRGGESPHERDGDGCHWQPGPAHHRPGAMGLGQEARAGTLRYNGGRDRAAHSSGAGKRTPPCLRDQTPQRHGDSRRRAAATMGCCQGGRYTHWQALHGGLGEQQVLADEVGCSLSWNMQLGLRACVARLVW